MTDTPSAHPALAPEALPPAPAPDGSGPPASPRAWLVIGPITVQSGATLGVGLLMLVVGLVAGFLLRPLVTLPASSPRTAGGQAALAAAATATLGPIAAAEATQAAAQSAALMDAIVGQTRHFRGSAAAPVTIIEFSDFQCPYCGRFALDTFPEIDQAYIDGGQVRLGYQHFAFLGDESRWAAEASECAGEQQAFWEFHDLLFANQAGENQGAFTKDNLKRLAQDLGLSPEAFNGCLDSGRYSGQVAAETQAAQQLGVRSTPTFLVNGRPVVGAQPFDVFAQHIDAVLNP